MRSRNVEIEIYPLSKTTVDRKAVGRWLNDMGATNFEIPSELAATDAALLVALAAKQCYMSFEPGLNPNVTKVRSDLTEYLDNILASGHGSVLEHATFTFAINGVSRVFTAEMNRHRAGWAISERSMRFIRFDDHVDWWMPLSLRDVEGDDADLAKRKATSRAVFHSVFDFQSQAYSSLVDIWAMDEGDKNFHYKKTVTSCLRRIIGMGCATGGVWTGNVRALRHVLAMRASSVAEEEICHVFSRIAEMMAESEPMIFGDFKRDAKGFWAPKYAKV
jgi:thymidylate synthase (FAD)